jgi:hypothetical protein
MRGNEGSDEMLDGGDAGQRWGASTAIFADPGIASYLLDRRAYLERRDERRRRKSFSTGRDVLTAT